MLADIKSLFADCGFSQILTQNSLACQLVSLSLCIQDGGTLEPTHLSALLGSSRHSLTRLELMYYSSTDMRTATRYFETVRFAAVRRLDAPHDNLAYFPALLSAFPCLETLEIPYSGYQYFSVHLTSISASCTTATIKTLVLRGPSDWNLTSVEENVLPAIPTLLRLPILRAISVVDVYRIPVSEFWRRQRSNPGSKVECLAFLDECKARKISVICEGRYR